MKKKNVFIVLGVVAVALLVFRGTASVPGYEIEYLDPKNYGHLDGEEIPINMSL